MALGSTQSVREMSTRNLLGGKGRPARRADNLTAICEPSVWKMWESRRLTTLWASTACYSDSFTFYRFMSFHILSNSSATGGNKHKCYLLTYLLTYGAEPFVRSCKL
jgi:hypothetical protein